MVATPGQIDANFFGEGARSPDRGGSTPGEEFFAYGRSAHRKDARARYRYIGVERDEETGLCMTGPRTYDPVVGRFHQGDPLTVPGVAPHAYSRGSPARLLDESGYEPLVALALGGCESSQPAGPSSTPDDWKAALQAIQANPQSTAEQQARAGELLGFIETGEVKDYGGRSLAAPMSTMAPTRSRSMGQSESSTGRPTR